MSSMESPPLYSQREDRAVINSRQRERYSLKLREALKERRLANKLEFIKRLGGKCVVCGYARHHAALHFDHLDRQLKRYEPGRVLDWSDREKAWEEIRKCRLVCANCHSAESFDGGHFGSQHSYNRRKEWTITCVRCGAVVRTKSPRTKYCGSLCKDHANRGRH